MRVEVGKLGLSRLRPLLERAGVRAELDANEVEGFLVTVNPAVGVPDELLGFFAFHYSASNIAAAFGKPEYSLLDLTLPPGYPPEKAELILSTFIEECRKYGVKLVGGHTGRYEGVEYPLASSTMLGRRLRPRLAPEEGDRVYLLGKVGSEAAWLAGAQVELEELTPLPKALKLAEIGGVKLAHDVSEGGLLGALLEVSAFYRRVIEVDRGSVPVEERAPRVSEPLALPSYGALIAVGDATVRRDAASLGLECYEIGRVLSEGTGVVVDGALVQEAPISEVVALYAPGVAGKGELAAVALAAERFCSLRGVERLIPEVGVNIAYARPGAESPNDVAAIEGRIVRTSRGVRACGKPAFGASRHLAGVLLAVSARRPHIRAALNLKPERELLEALGRLGLRVARVEPSSACPIAEASKKGLEADAYYYEAAPGLEPSLVILAEDPLKLIELLEEALALLERRASGF